MKLRTIILFCLLLLPCVVLAQGPKGPGPQINAASRIIVQASYPTGTRGQVFVSSSTGIAYFCKSATCASNGTGWASMDASTAAPSNATYITKVPESSLSAEQALSSLASALLVNTTTTGVLSAYAGTSCTNQFIRSMNALVAATCASVSLTADVSGRLPFANLTQASGASKLLGRGSASGAGDYQEIIVGSGLTMTGQMLSAAGITNSAGANVVPKSDGTNLVASRITDAGTEIEADSATGKFYAGDVNGVGNNMLIFVDDAAHQISITGGTHNTQLVIDDAAKTNTLFADTRVALDSRGGASKIGDVGGLFNTTLLTVNDATQAITATASTETLTIDGTAHTANTAAATSIGLAAPKIVPSCTVTAGGTTTVQTINQPCGSINLAATESSKVLNNSTVSSSSVIICTVGSNDTTLKSCQAVAGAGTITFYGNAAATAEARVNFWILTP